jgi:DNA polymerase-3 subunit alpha
VFEKEMLGLYVSDHPLMGVEAALRRTCEATVTELLDGRDGDVRTVGGVITGLTRKYTRRGDLMATFTLEDLQASINTWVFPRTMQDYGWALADDAIVIVKGRLDLRDDEVKLVVIEIARPELTPADEAPLEVALPIATLSDAMVTDLKKVLAAHAGLRPVVVHVGTKRLRLGREFCVDTANGLHADLRSLLGVDCIVVA